MTDDNNPSDPKEHSSLDEQNVENPYDGVHPYSSEATGTMCIITDEERASRLKWLTYEIMTEVICHGSYSNTLVAMAKGYAAAINIDELDARKEIIEAYRAEHGMSPGELLDEMRDILREDDIRSIHQSQEDDFER